MAKARIYYTRDKRRDRNCNCYVIWSALPKRERDSLVNLWGGSGKTIIRESRKPFLGLPKIKLGQMMIFEQVPVKTRKEK